MQERRTYAGIILLHQLSKLYEYEDEDNMIVYNEVLSQVNVLLLNVLGECKDINNPIQAQFIYKIIKIFFKSFQGAIPASFCNIENYSIWSNYILGYINTP